MNSQSATGLGRGQTRPLMRILLVALAQSEPLGSGWNRRVHQVEQDLQESCGAEVEVYNARQAIEEQLPRRPRDMATLIGSPGLQWLKQRLVYETKKTAANPHRVLRKTDLFSTAELRGPALEDFGRFVARRGPFDAVVCDNAMYAAAVDTMIDAGVPCYYVLHHLESLAWGQVELLRATRGQRRGTVTKGLMAVCGDLADEIAAVSRARQVFAISRLEQEFLSSAGVNATYYPYRPMGGTLRWCEEIRQARSKTAVSTEPMVFLSSATANPHNSENLGAVLRELLAVGMPPGCELVITGMEPHELAAIVPGFAPRAADCGIRFAGKLSNDDFGRLLVSVAALVIPKYVGFGALTRFADAAACGIPVITNASERITSLQSHEAFVINDRDSWRQGMELVATYGGDVARANFARPRSTATSSPLGEIRSSYAAVK